MDKAQRKLRQIGGLYLETISVQTVKLVGRLWLNNEKFLGIN